jgi:DNA-binding response OmpR family regulator
MLLEDQTPFRVLLTLWLQKRGYMVSSAESLREAKAYEDSFDVLLADVRLPDGLGFTLLPERREQYRFGGISFSGYGEAKDFAESKAAGYRFHLVKPFALEELLEKIELLVKSQ